MNSRFLIYALFLFVGIGQGDDEVSFTVGENKCGAGFDLHRPVVSHVPVQFGKQQVVDRNRTDTGRGLGRA